MNDTMIANLIQKTLSGTGDSDRHMMTLFSLVLQLKAKRILELGTRSGDTLVPLVLGANYTDGIVETVDIDPNCSNRLYLKYPEIAKYKQRFIRHCSDSIKWLEGRIRHNQIAIPGPDIIYPPFDLIFIDDWHSAAHVKKELDLCSQLLSTRGLIVLHDLMHSNFDPKYNLTDHPPGNEFEGGGPAKGVSDFIFEQKQKNVLWEIATIPVNNGLSILRQIIC